ncbi:hypothetical protein WCLP8_3090002 [uncultured Gammaproteobacteria bacterium]
MSAARPHVSLSRSRTRWVVAGRVPFGGADSIRPTPAPSGMKPATSGCSSSPSRHCGNPGRDQLCDGAALFIDSAPEFGHVQVIHDSGLAGFKSLQPLAMLSLYGRHGINLGVNTAHLGVNARNVRFQFRSHGGNLPRQLGVYCGNLPGQLGVYRCYLSRQVLSQLLDSREYLV